LLVLFVCGFGFAHVIAQDGSPIDQGIAALEAEDYDEALRLFETALAEFQAAGDRLGEADARYYIGLAQYGKTEYRDARQNFERALTIYRELVNRDGEARALHQVGRAYHATQDYPNALTFYQQALRTVREETEEGLIRLHLGDLYYEQRQYAEASDQFEESGILFFGLSDDPNRADSLLRLGDAYYWQWQLDNALDSYLQAAAVYAELGSVQPQALSLQRAGILEHHRGELAPALEYFQQALSLFQQVGDAVGEGRVTATIGDIYRQYGYTAAIDYLDEAESIQQRVGDELGRAYTLNFRGEYALAQGEYREARTQFDSALRIALQLDDIVTEAQAYHGIGRASAFGDIGTLRDALNTFDFALRRYRDDLKDPWDTRRVFTSLAWVWYEQEDFVQAERYFFEARNQARSAGDDRGEGEVYFELGRSFEGARRKDYPQAVAYYEDAVRALNVVGDSLLIGQIYVRIAGIELLDADYSTARENYDLALSEFRSIENAVWSAVALNGSGEVLQTLGLYVEALASYREALSLVEGITDALRDERLIETTRGLVYQRLGTLYLDVGLYDEAQTYLNQAADIHQAMDDDVNLAITNSYLGDYYFLRSDYSSARDFYQQGLSLGERTGSVYARALAQLGIGRVLAETGGTPLQLQESFEGALSGFRDEIRDSRGTRRVLTIMGLKALADKDYDTAARLLSDVMREDKRVRDFRGEGYTRLNLALVYAAQKDNFGALDSYKNAVNAFRQVGDFLGEGLALAGTGDLELGRARYTPALDAYNQMLLAYQNAGDRTRQGVAYTRIGQVYQDQGRFELALAEYEKALAAIDDPSDDNELQVEAFIQASRAAALRSRGDTYREFGQFTLATADLDEADSIQAQVEDEAGRSRTLIARGELLLEQRRLGDALDAFLAAQDIAVRNGDVFVQGLANYGIARVYTEDNDPTNQFDERTAYDRALNTFRFETPNPTRAREVLISFAFSFLKTGEIDQAQDYFFAAQNEAREAQDPIGEGYALLEIGNLFASRLEFNEALRYYNNARSLFTRSQEWIGEGRALESIARVHILQVEYPQALEQYQQMVTLYTANEDSIRLGRANSLIGEVYQLQSQYAAALNQHLEALVIVQNAEFDVSDSDASALIASTEAYIYRNIATVQIALAQYTEAQQNLNLARERAISAGNALEQTIVTHLIGNILALGGDYLSALNEYESLLPIYEELGEGQREGQLRLDIGDAYYGLIVEGIGTRQDEGVRASIIYQQAFGVAFEINDLLMQAEAYWRLGRINNQLQRDDEAAQYLNNALAIAEDINSPTLLTRILIEFGLLAEEDGDTARALDYYQQAIALVEDIHADIRLEAGQISFAADNIIPYHRLAVQYARSDPMQAFLFAERGRSRTFLFQVGNERIEFGSGATTSILDEYYAKRDELLTLRTERQELAAAREIAVGEEAQQLSDTIADLDERINQLNTELGRLDERINTQDTVLAQFTQVNVVDIAAIQAVMAEDTTLLVYYVVPGSSVDENGTVFAFVIGKTSFTVTELTSTNATDLGTAITGFNGDRFFTDTETPRLLYNQLIAPVQDDLTTQKLVIVPHGVLNYLAFAALTAEDGQVLGDQFTLSYAPSATFYTLLVNRRLPAGAGGDTALVIGNPASDQPGLADLPGAEDEAEQVGTLLGATPLLRGNATETAVQLQAESATILHIASHGVFVPGNPLSTNLALASDLENDGALEVREIYGLRLSASAPLVVLSACDTVTGELSEGDEFQGLTRAFLLSGARGVVASLWQVDDAATAALMIRFYENRQNGMSDAQALQDAQRFIREHPDHPEWAAPDYWAAFILVGLP
jgi:tetratricopeptide (TPR) repeat protein